MFTGIITEMGTVLAINTAEADPIYTIGAPETTPRLKMGDSVAVCGVCLTVVGRTAEQFMVQVSGETLSLTNVPIWTIGWHVNLEPSLRYGDEMGGHMVSGHVDGMVKVTDRYQEGDSLRFRFEMPKGFERFIAKKGTIALNGVSLTINDVQADSFGVNIIPHTQRCTTFGMIDIGEAINFEVDTIARYLDRLLKGHQGQGNAGHF